MQMVRNCVWCPPEAIILKFNVDGSARGSPGISGAGGILRNAESAVLGRFSKPLGVLCAYQAEVKAILLALKFSKEFGFSQVLVESDSSLAVGWVRLKSNRSLALLNDLNAIDWIMKEVACVGVVHTLREANGEADELAKSGCDCSEPLWEKLI